MTTIESLPTPSLLLDRHLMHHNAERMAHHISKLGCVLRPHVKTHKSRQVFEDIVTLNRPSGITVSTLHEARYFFEAGQTDILYAVGLTPSKVDEIADLKRQGCHLTAILDNADMARLVDEQALRAGIILPILIELDVDNHRSGVSPDGAVLLELAEVINASKGLSLGGVMTHAGGSYDCHTPDQIRACARNERGLSVLAAERLHEAGFPCETVSIGSTPTAVFTEDLSGVTEVRAGVYPFMDLFQAGLGVARVEDIAISVLATVIGHQQDKGWVIVDAGWMAMSRDRGTATQTIDQGYGLVCDLSGKPCGDVIMGSANQEHGILMARTNDTLLDVGRFPVGSRVRILPNHACATAGQYQSYNVIAGDELTAQWQRINGW